MRRYTAMLVGAAAAALLPFGAYAQNIDPNTTMFTTGGIDVDAPVFNNMAVAGPNTTAVDISTSGAPFNALDQVDIDVVVFIHDANGMTQAVGVFDSVNGGADSADGGGALSATIDFSAVPLGGALNTAINTANSFVGVINVSGGGIATGVRIGVVVNDLSGNGVDTLLDLDDVVADQTITPDQDGPVLTQVLRDGDTRIIFVFDDEIETNSTLGNLDNTSFESSTTIGGVYAAFAALAFPGNPTIVATSNGVAMQFAIAGGQENLAPSIGQFVRIALPDNGGTTNDDIVDLAENVADMQVGVQVEAVSAPTIVSAEWIVAFDNEGLSIDNAIRVKFSGALSDPGAAAFYSIALAGGDDPEGDYNVTDAALDPEDASCVLLDVGLFGGTSGIGADGLGLFDDDDELFEIMGDSMAGAPPVDILGTDFDGEGTADLDDGINPTVTSDVFTVDANGDGVIDGFGLYFSEPLNIADIDEDGFIFTKVDQTVYPFALFLENLALGITDPLDDANEAEVTTEGDDSDMFQDTITGFSLGDEDADGGRLMQNNCLIIAFDSSMVDWDNDGMSGGSDTDGEAMPGTFDEAFADIEIIAADAGIADANSNAFEDDVDEQPFDGAPPVAARVEFSTGDNVSGGMQKPSEQDDEVGDSDNNNTAFIIYNEPIDDTEGGATNIIEEAFRWGNGPNDRFMEGDFDTISGDSDSILVMQDNSGGGFMPGLPFTIVSPNSVFDGAGNMYPGSGLSGAPELTVLDASAPYVLLQSDINGNEIFSAFLGGEDDEGFATTVTMTFSRDIKVGTEGTTSDWEIEGVGNPTAVDLDGNVITLTFPTDLVGITEVVEITYLGGDISDPTMRISSADGTMAAVAEMDDSWDARAVPQPNSDGEFMAVMDIAGVITDIDGESTVPSGTKVFGMIGVPVAKSASFTMGGVRVTLDDSTEAGFYSIQAITNRLLGLEANLYIIVDGAYMYFSNYKDDEEFPDAVISVNINANNLNNVTFTGSGSFLTGSGTPNASISQGTIRIGWDVLRSDEGNSADLFDDGYEIFGAPLLSSAVVSGEDGSYLLHMTAPISAFNDRLNANGWPVIIVIELPNGKRYPVSSMLNAIDLLGPITFAGLNRQSDPFNSDANLVFNPNLANIGMQSLFEGWNALADDRNSGWQATNNAVLAPAGVTNIVTGTTLASTHPLDQFVFFYDENNDGMWTAADDDDERFDGIVISSRCLGFFSFVLNSTGVKTGDNIRAITGGYATGVFNSEGNGRIGVFQFGPAITASTVFTALTGTGSFPDNNVTLGWALVTSPVSSTNLLNFLQTNASDFLIIFNRTSNSNVTIRTFSSAGGDAEEIEQGQALFLHK